MRAYIYIYIYQEVLGRKDATPKDEDDNKAHFFHLVKVFKCITSEQIVIPLLPAKEPVDTVVAISYPLHTNHLLPSIYLDINVPPPDVHIVLV